MTPNRTISRRSFLARVSGVSALALGGCATRGGPIEEDPYTPDGGRGAGGSGESGGCTDGDSGRYHDRPGAGRACAGHGHRRPPRRD
jgi:hypothetical protein